MLDRLDDQAVFSLDGTRLAFTTDSFVVKPLFFPGGDIGSLAVHGTVNDLAMGGAQPLYLSAAFILEGGFSLDTLRRIVDSMHRAAESAGVTVVTGDTKVVEKGKGDGLFITTTGIGRIADGIDLSARIDPVTRIEGHAKITLHMDDQGRVEDAHFHVTQFRGFEKFCEGRPFSEMPALMARICGICPVSHLMASAKACDARLAVRIPPTADKLRRIFGLAQVVQSHALSLFYMSSPDLLLGMDADPATANLFGVVEKNPALALDGIQLRQFEQQIIERLGGKRIHPAWVVPRGVSEPLTAANRDAILGALPEALAIAERTVEWFKSITEKLREEIATFGNFPTLFMGIVKDGGGLTFYDGKIRIADASGNVVAEGLDPLRYSDYLGEKVEPWSYLKSTYYKPQGFPEGIYRLGPLARMNVADRCGTPRADQELAEFHELQRTAVLSSFHYHHARLIEILYCIERMEQLLNDPEILFKHVRAVARPNELEGVGACEAPRGTLFHHYKIDEQGLIRWANLVIATGHNSVAMNRSILQVAKHFVHGDRLVPAMLNRVEAVIRTYDPCLSCSTHAAGQMALKVELRNANGDVVAQISRP